MLALVNLVPGPGRPFVQPYPVVAALTPGAFREGDNLGRRAGLEVFRTSHTIDRGVVGKLPDGIVQPPRPLEPPVSEKLRVIHGGDDSRLSRLLLVLSKY